MGSRGQILGVIFAPRRNFRRSEKKKWGKIKIFQKSDCAKSCPKIDSESWRNHFFENLGENLRKKLFSEFLHFLACSRRKIILAGFHLNSEKSGCANF